jgi:hypothetical protein
MIHSIGDAPPLKFMVEPVPLLQWPHEPQSDSAEPAAYPAKRIQQQSQILARILQASHTEQEPVSGAGSPGWRGNEPFRIHWEGNHLNVIGRKIVSLDDSIPNISADRAHPGCLSQQAAFPAQKHPIDHPVCHRQSPR